MVPQLKAFIVENDVSYGGLAYVLKKYFPEIHLLGYTEDIEKSIGPIQTLRPDVVFLDIDLKDGHGFKIMEKAGENCHFIITASMEKHALKAISFDVLAYLLKPLKLEEILMAVNKAKIRVEQARELELRLQVAENKHGGVKILALPSMDKIELIEKKDIVYLKAEGRYTTFLLSCGTTKMASKNLGEFEKHLDSNIFFRTHHSFIVNLTQVQNINKAAGNYLELKTGESIPIAKRKLGSLHTFLTIK